MKSESPVNENLQKQTARKHVRKIYYNYPGN